MEIHPLPAEDARTLGFDQLQTLIELERKIDLRTSGRIRDLRVESVGGSVVLSGRTSTYYVKQLASQIALDEQSSLALQNAIEVV